MKLFISIFRRKAHEKCECTAWHWARPLGCGCHPHIHMHHAHFPPCLWIAAARVFIYMYIHTHVTIWVCVRRVSLAIESSAGIQWQVQRKRRSVISLTAVASRRVAAPVHGKIPEHNTPISMACVWERHTNYTLSHCLCTCRVNTNALRARLHCVQRLISGPHKQLCWHAPCAPYLWLSHRPRWTVSTGAQECAHEVVQTFFFSHIFN